jgi:hypothetical protein
VPCTGIHPCLKRFSFAPVAFRIPQADSERAADAAGLPARATTTITAGRIFWGKPVGSLHGWRYRPAVLLYLHARDLENL